MANVVIFGTGDIARLAQFYFETDSEHSVVAFTLDKAYLTADTYRGLPLVDFATLTETYPPADYKLFVAIGYTGMNQVRRDKYFAAKALGYELVSYVSSRCTYLAQTPPGDNCFILEDNTIQPFVSLGANVTLWSGNHIGHDATIGDHCFISSHVVISGHVVVGESCFIGVNATLRDGLKVAPLTLIGAGAVVMKDTEPEGVYLPKRAEQFSKRSTELSL